MAGRTWVRHSYGVRPIWAIAAFLALVCAACTSASGGTTPSGSAPRTMTAPHTTVPTTTQPPVSSGSSFSGPPRPAQATIPADVPRTGPNTKRGEKPPLMPLEATQHTPEGAKAFAAFFIKTIDWGYATMSGAYLRHYARKTCLGCASFADTFDRARRSDDRYVGGRITIFSPHLRPGKTIVDVPFAISAFEELDHQGKVVQADRPHRHETFLVSLQWRRITWSVARLALET